MDRVWVFCFHRILFLVKFPFWYFFKFKFLNKFFIRINKNNNNCKIKLIKTGNLSNKNYYAKNTKVYFIININKNVFN